MSTVIEHSPAAVTNGRTSTEDIRIEALRRLEKRREFRVHLNAFLGVNAFLWLIWGVVFASTGFWFPWPLFPLAGWGIGLSFHAWDVYGRRPFTTEQIEREAARLRAPR